MSRAYYLRERAVCNKGRYGLEGYDEEFFVEERLQVDKSTAGDPLTSPTGK